MRVPCACKIYLIETENATYVRDGVPLCNEATCQKVKEHRDLRRVPFADEDDQVACPYGKSPYARFQDI